MAVRTPTLRSRYEGALLGLAVGDALGTTLEFKPPGTFAPLTTMQGGGPFQLPKGAWTDDTAMAMCLAESLVACQGFDAGDQMTRYLKWWQDGTWSSTGVCFDIGNTIRSALERYLETKDPFAGSTSAATAGNGSLMRLAPIALAYLHHPELLDSYAAQSSATTHGAKTALDACRYYASNLALALLGVEKSAVLAPPTPFSPPLCPEIEAVVYGSFKYKRPPAIRGTGYVVESLEAALWALAKSETFAQGALLAVNLGNDADTTGAIYGQLAGAFYGAEAIPAAWQQDIVRKDDILALAHALLKLAGRPDLA